MAPPLVLVFVGGCAGTLVRHELSDVVGTSGGWPLGTLTVNLLGALAIGVLLGVTRDRVAQQLLGTGFLGGFTTYSALAVETAGLLRAGDAGTALTYALVTVLGGLALTWCGARVARAA